MKLNDEQRELTLKNLKLVFFVLKNSFHTNYNDPNYEDLTSIGYIGLMKAAATFDKSKNYKFSGYAIQCIRNEILMFFRKANKEKIEISLSAPISSSDSSETRLIDILPNPDSCFFEKIENQEALTQLINFAFYSFNSIDFVWLLFSASGLKNQPIADIVHFTQSYVSRCLRKSIALIRSTQFNYENCEKRDFMKIEKDEYKFTFCISEFKDFNEVLAVFMRELSSFEEIPNFKICCNNSTLVIYLQASPIAFAVIAKLIHTVSLKYPNNKSFAAPDSDMNEKLIANTKPITTSCKEVSSSMRVRTEILKRTSFTRKELLKHFPDISPAIISNVLVLLKNENKIATVSRGSYVVTKDT